MKNLIYIYLLLSGCFLAGCKEPETAAPISNNDVAPAPVTEVQVQNTPGGAILSYSLPDSESLLYVMAEYSRKNGVVSEKKASYYNNNITLEGFAEAKDYQVLLYAVSKGGKKSVPVAVTITPLEPPVMSVLQSLSMGITFGGVFVNFENENEADIKINVIATDSQGAFQPAETFYTKSKNGTFSVRGFEPVKRTFGAFIRDRWDNYSDTVYIEGTPRFEEALNKNNFNVVKLPGDTWEGNNTRRMMETLWDGITQPVRITGQLGGYFVTQAGIGFPQHFTFDLGVTTSLSRFKYYTRADGVAPYTNAPRYFEIWGSNNPNSDGSWDSWTKLGDYEMIKPSGAPQGTVTDEDRLYVDGIDYEIPANAPPVRYIRFKTLDVWMGDFISITELDFWGSGG